MIRKPLLKIRQAWIQSIIGAGLLALAVGGFSPAAYANGNSLHAKLEQVVSLLHSILKGFKPQPASSPSGPEDGCGYQVSSGTYSIWPGGYLAWVDVKNVSGATATDFEVLIDVGDATVNGHLAEFQQVENGYLVSAPSWLQWQKIRPGDKYRFQFIGKPNYEGVTPYVISINGVTCDTESPEVSLTASDGFFNADGTLTLAAEASDNVAVRKVVFERGGEVVGVDWDAPFELEIDVDEALNGFHLYTATAYDPSGNQSATSDPERVFVAIGNKFFGTAPGGPEDYEHLLTYFNQVTPENQGKWGEVEGTRDVMNWEPLDTAYFFAQNNGLPFKFHTLLWGQQQPGWIDDLTPEEQLEEINEWMSEVAARYPDLTMVEVVNEPLHAPPSYLEALGGTGETGYDWVITAFELGREHFPNAQLILNDYQILHLPEFTADYLEVINLLQERGLIDAIGVQAHFLERTQGSMVQTNLDTLAETGLPIYVSEFDLNLSNDAQHANMMRELFTVFWEHPAVAGVTHWGHLQGSIWRTEAYLIRSDDSQRPALDWLVCYLGGGSDCPVPVYVPPGWQGDEFGVNLEAELYDEAEGLVALGDVVAFTDDGDWLSFAGVEFQAGWDTLGITYAKGNTEVGSITVHLDSLENAPVMTIPLEPTAGWGSFDTLEVPWDSISGTHDVYIGFHDVFGVANVDRFRFGTPPPTTGVNLVVDGGFEGATLSGWQSWNGSTLSLTTGQAFAGNQSLLATNRPNNAQFAVYNLTGSVSAGTTYQVSAQVLQDGAAADTVRLAAKVGCASGDSFPWLDNNTGVQPGVWTELSGELTIPEDCDVVDVAIFFEGTTPGVDVYLDEVQVIAPDTGGGDGNLVADGGFESATLSGWQSWNGSTLSLSGAQAFAGNQSLLATNRPNTAQFAVYNLTGAVTPGTTYSVSAQVLHTGAATDTVRLAAKVECTAETAPAGHNTFPWLHNHTGVNPGEWTQLSANLAIPDCDIVDVAIFFEGTTAGVDVYIDEVQVIPPSASLVADGGFEGAALNGWQSWNGSTLSLSGAQAFAGSQSLSATNRPDTAQFAVYNLTSVVTPGTTYAVSARALQDGAAVDTVRLAAKIECTAETTPAGHNSFPWLHNHSGVNPGEWTELSADLVIPDCDIVDVAIFFEGTSAGVDVYLDEVSVVPL
ncbi:MAG TPA: endo-1,4-beta-xylanase [Gammaproteobacteria bacterium]